MITFRQVPKSGDPSNRLQWFEPLTINVTCCRYWWLEKWKSNKMSFPYWRLYWNKNEGAYIHKHKRIDLSPEKLILIPPNTLFSTDIDYNSTKNGYNRYDLVGSWVKNKEEENLCLQQEKILHLFIHFNLGNQLDNAIQEIYDFQLMPEQKWLVDKITDKLLMGITEFDVHSSLDVYQLILSAVNQISIKNLIPNRLEPRIIQTLDYINLHLNKRLPNTSLAKEIHMSTNSFTRFFKDHLKYSPQEYIRKLRVDKACNLLDHSGLTIDEISELCGFSDRFHFSKVFKKVKGIPPAEYKKRFTLKSTQFSQ